MSGHRNLRNIFQNYEKMLYYSFRGVARRNISSRDQKGSRDKKKLMHTPKTDAGGPEKLFFVCMWPQVFGGS